jgi:hypothetical protein
MWKVGCILEMVVAERNAGCDPDVFDHERDGEANEEECQPGSATVRGDGMQQGQAMKTAARS